VNDTFKILESSQILKRMGIEGTGEEANMAANDLVRKANGRWRIFKRGK